MTNSDIILGKILNQSCHLLIVFYIVLKKNISIKNTVIICVLAIQLIDVANEIMNYFFPLIDTIEVDIVFVMSQRLLWTIIFVVSGASFISKNRLKNIFNIAFGTLIFCVFLSAFEKLDKLQPMVILSILILYNMSIYGSNFKDKVFHEVGIGALLIFLADLAFLYSGLHDDLHWMYLYLLPRIFLNLGEILILFKILEKYRVETTLPITI
jgi:hypothetical protein